MQLTQREEAVFCSIVRNFILEAKPIGSRFLSKWCGMEVSPATIRNVMADLEEKGLITQPHTSAGRIPTDKGYRYYVDSLIKVDELSRQERELIQFNLQSATKDIETILENSSKALGNISSLLGVVLAPRFYQGIFEKLELIEMPDTGVMNSTPPITYFGHSLFQHQVPCGRGRVILKGADTALPINVYTTKGVLTPRVFKRGTPVKVVFRDQREGKPTDIFAIPLNELPKSKQKKKCLLESELDWRSPKEPKVPKMTARSKKLLEEVLENLQDRARQIPGSARAKKDLAGWKRKIQVKTGGGNFVLEIANKNLKAKKGKVAKPDLVMVCKNPSLFNDWMNLKESLTNAIIKEDLWISINSEFITVFKLDRIPRSLRRTKK